MVVMYKKFLLLFLALTVASVFATSAFALGSGSQVENFTLKDLSGKSVSLNQFKGKVVVLNFWASWCPPCRNEMPEFNEMRIQKVRRRRVAGRQYDGRPPRDEVEG